MGTGVSVGGWNPTNTPRAIDWPADYAPGHQEVFEPKLRSGLPVRVEIGLAHGVGHGPSHPFARITTTAQDRRIDRIYTVSADGVGGILQIGNGRSVHTSGNWERTLTTGSRFKHSTEEQELILSIIDGLSDDIRFRVNDDSSVLRKLPREGALRLKEFLSKHLGIDVPALGVDPARSAAPVATRG